MLLNSVVIVLREVLEAALLISILLALTRILSLQARWLTVGLVLGVAGAAAYGHELGAISDWFGGVGQEVANAVMQILIYSTLLACLFQIARRSRQRAAHTWVLPAAMAAAVALATAREGSEILIYISGFIQSSDFIRSVGVGSIIGAGIGCSVGILFYYLLISQPARRSGPIALVLLALIGGGMCMQATQLLIQADWLGVAGPLWDTSSILAEGSVPGQLLYALIGYEASPSALEIGVYLFSLLIAAAALLCGRYLPAGRPSAV